MSVIDMTICSHALGMDTRVSVILPEVRLAAEPLHPDKKYPVLYLLHGHSDGANAYMRKSVIELFAREHELIVVMPDAARSFYTDSPCGHDYYTYITEELPVKMKNAFHISDRREDTFIAGLSMGGYGALKIALSRPERYSKCAVMSPGIDFVTHPESKRVMGTVFTTPHSDAVLLRSFGPEEDYPGSENDLCQLVRNLRDAALKPDIFQIIGHDDMLIEQNRDFHAFMEKEGRHLNYTYKETEGMHNWYFWNRALGDVFEFLGFPVSDHF